MGEALKPVSGASESEAAGPRPLGERAIESATWVALSRALIEGVSFLALLATSRLLTPAEIGTAAVPLALAALANGLLGGGIGSALIQTEETTRPQIEAAGALSLLLGAALTGISSLTALALEPYLGSPITDMMLLASPVWLITSIAAVPQALRSRRLAFKRLAGIDVAAQSLGLTTTVLLAALDQGAASLVVGMLVAAIGTATLSLARSEALVPRWHAVEVRSIVGFGLPAAGSSVLWIATRNVDYALLAGRLPAFDVGIYFRSFSLAVDYQRKITSILSRVMFPVLARAGTTRMDAFRGRAIRLQTLVVFPPLALLAVTAPALIPLLLGDQWQEAVLPTRILVAAGLALAIGTGIGPAMLAAGRPRQMLMANLLALVCLTMTVAICVGYGVVVTCVGVATYRWVALAAMQYFLGSRLLGIPFARTMIIDPGPAAVASLGLVAVSLPVFLGLQELPIGAFARVTASGGVGLAAYTAVLRVVFPGVWSESREVLARVYHTARGWRSHTGLAHRT